MELPRDIPLFISQGKGEMQTYWLIGEKIETYQWVLDMFYGGGRRKSVPAKENREPQLDWKKHENIN